MCILIFFNKRDYSVCSKTFFSPIGTGTAAGDPVEANALGTFFKDKGSIRHRYIGSVKTNIGHLESAAGTAGLIKVLLMMKHSKIVPTLFFERCNPKIDFPSMNLSVPTKVIDWPTHSKAACVNSFGFGGTNCHAFVKTYGEYLLRQSSQVESLNVPCIVCFSGKNEKSLKGSIEEFVKHPEITSFDVHDVSFTSTARRDHYNVRYATVVEDMSDLLTRLHDYLQKGGKGTSVAKRARVVFAFGGMGTSWRGMCKELIAVSNVFRDAIKEIDHHLSEYVPWTLIGRFEKESEVEDPEFSPIAIFASQIGLSKLWISLGVKPACVVGQSVGEVAAAHIAGILSMRDAVKIIFYRTSLMAQVVGGKMIVVRNMQVAMVRDIVKVYSGLANISLEYSPISCAVSGNSETIARIKQDLQTRSRSLNIQIQLLDLNVPVAYHCHHVDVCKAGLREAVADITPQTPAVDMISSVTSELVTDLLLPEYWVNNMREPVRFYEAVQKTFAKGYKNVYIEIGPRPVLRSHINDIFPHEEVVPVVSMAKMPEWKIFLQALVSAYELGVKIEWGNIPHKGKIITPVPRYSFNPRRNLQLCESAHMVLAGVQYMRKEHPYVNQVDNTDNFKVIITLITFPSVYDHIVSGMLIVPGALYAETGFGLITQSADLNAPQYAVSVTFEQPCSFARDGALELDLEVKKSPPTGSEVKKYDNYNVAVVKGNKTYANIHLQACNMRARPSSINIPFIQSQCSQIVERDEIYGMLKNFGFTYGPAYTLLMYAQKNSQECLAKILYPKAMFPERNGTTVHPSILDGMIQTSIILMDGVDDARDLLPRSIGRLISHRPIEDEMYIYTTLKSTDRKLTLYDIKLTTLSGDTIVDLEDLAIKSLTDKSGGIENVYKSVWRPILDTNYPHQECKMNALFITDQIPESTPSSLIKKCIQYDVNKEPGETVAKDLDLALKSTRENFEFIVVTANTTMAESEDAYSVQTKAFNLCMMLKSVYVYANTKNLHLPIYFFTKRAFPLENAPAETENVNPLMTTLWGLTRCALKEQIYTDFVTLDLHLPEASCTLPFMASLAEMLTKDLHLKNYPEWMVTEDKLYVNLIVQVDSETPVPTFRHNFADKSQNVILLSKEPAVLTDTFPVYHECQTKDDTQTHVKIDVSATAFQNPLLFNMTMLYSTMEKRRTLKGNGYPLFALENIGLVEGDSGNKKQKKYCIPSISCYPVPIGSKIRVPLDATITADMISDYVPGDLTRLVALWHLHSLVASQNATILASAATAKLGEVLICLLMSSAKPKHVNVNLVVVEQLNHAETLHESIVSLVLIEETVVPLLARQWQKPECFISLTSLLDPSARAHVSFFLPNVEVKLVDTAMAFHPRTITQAVQKVKKWMVRHSSLMPRVAECLHKNPTTTGVFKEVAADLDELLEMQIINTNTSKVRVERMELFRKDAVYIVVGGQTGLGWLYVTFLAKHGAGGIAIVNRRQATADKQNEITQLSTSEACVIKTFQADVTHMDSLKTFMAQMEDTFPNSVLKGVFFGAAVVDDQLLSQMDSKSFMKVMSPKVMGAWNLHQLTKSLPLDYFVLHSSMTSVFGNAGQSNYGAGNAFMDALAHYRRHLNLAGQSINWGALDLGMLSDHSDSKKILEAQGFVLMSEEEICGFIIPILLLDWGQIMPCRFDKEILMKRLKRDMLIPFQYRLKSMLDSTVEEVKIEEDILLALQGVREQALDQRIGIYERYVIALASQVLSVEDGAIKSDSGLVDYGLDSIVAMTMINQIYKEVQCRLPAIVFISGEPTSRSIAQAIEDVLAGKLAEGSEFGTDTEQPAIEAAPEENKPVSQDKKTVEPSQTRRVSFVASTIESSQLVIYKRHPRKQSLHGVVDIDIPISQKEPEIVRKAILATLEVHPITCTVFKEDSSKRNSSLSFEKQILPPEKALDFRVAEKDGKDMQIFSEETFDVKEKGPLRFILQQSPKTKLRIIFHKAGFDVRSIYQFIQDLVAAFDPTVKKTSWEKDGVSKSPKQSDDFNLELEKIYRSKAETFAQFWAKTLSQDIANTSLQQQNRSQFMLKSMIATNGNLRTVLSPDLTQKIIKFIRQHNVSLLGLVASAYQTLIHILTGKSTVSLMFPLDLRRYIKDIDNDIANYSNEIPLLAHFDLTKKVTIQEFIIHNNKRIQQHIDHGVLPFTFFQGLAERTMELFNQSPHGISIEMLSPHDAAVINGKLNSGIKSPPAMLPLGLETNLFIQHNLLNNVVVLYLGYKECVINGMKAEVLMKNLISLLTGVMTNPDLQLKQIKKHARKLNKSFCAVQ